MRTGQRNGWWAGPLPTLVLPLAVGAFTLVGTFGAARGQPLARPLDALGLALLLAGAVSLVVRRRYPAGVLSFAAAAAGVYLGLDYPYGPVFLAGLVAMCSAVVSGHRRSAYLVTGAAFAALLVLHFLRFPDQPLPLFGAGGWLVSRRSVAVVELEAALKRVVAEVEEVRRRNAILETENVRQREEIALLRDESHKNAKALIRAMERIRALEKSEDRRSP